MRIPKERLEAIITARHSCECSVCQERKDLAMNLLEARKVLKDARRLASKGKAVVIALVTRYFAEGE